jgi:hypothetical protein
MKMHRMQHTPAAIVPALLTLWLTLGGPEATHSAAADFSSIRVKLSDPMPKHHPGEDFS